MPFDPQDGTEQVKHEFDQRVQSGFDVEHLVDRMERLEPGDRVGADALFQDLEKSQRLRGWRYVEPDSLVDILDTLPPARAVRAPAPDEFEDKILGGWLGRVAGCMIGKPVEDGTHWTRPRIRMYLELADAYPLLDYIPALQPMPSGYQLVPDCWRTTTLGNVHGSSRDDDIDYSMLALDLLETRGANYTTVDVSGLWLRSLPYELVYTAERVTYRNLIHGIDPSNAGGYRNPYREWIGALIRGDVFGYVNPGDPRSAAALAHQDACLSHRGNGIYGELWAAALVAAAFTARSVVELVRSSLDHVPSSSRIWEAISSVLDMFESGATWEQTLDAVDARWSGYSWVHTVNNAAAIAAGLLFSDEDFGSAIGLTVMAGMDTDSNGATAGSVMGAYLGSSKLPTRLTAPLQDEVRSALFGFDRSSISELARRTVALTDPRGAR